MFKYGIFGFKFVYEHEINLLSSQARVTRTMFMYLLTEWEGRTRKYLARGHGVRTERSVVQSLNSPFVPPHVGAEPELAKRRVQDNLHAHAQNAAIFPPQIEGKNHIWKYFPNLVCSAISLNNNIPATIFIGKKTCHLMHNPKSVEFHHCHAKRHSICFLTTISKITKEISVKIC